MRWRCGGVVPRKLALATRPELDRVVVGDVAVPPQVAARALGVLLRGAVLAHERGQAVVAHVLHQNQPFLDQVLKIQQFLQKIEHFTIPSRRTWLSKELIDRNY